MDTIKNLFFQKLGHFFDVQRRAGETDPQIPPLVAGLGVKEGTRRKRRNEPGSRIAYKWFVAKKATG